ncbi:MAG: hypothetical protein O6913_02920 [Chloroflexi bacterium]|nr:hypothetical protein [Chloroflexota bacterium]
MPLLPNVFDPGGAAAAKEQKALRRQRQLEVFESTVRNPSADIDAQTRRHAAEELIAMDVPEATEKLIAALGCGEPVVIQAVLEAMELSPNPVAGLLPAAVGTLDDASDANREKLSLILPRYGRPALDLVAQHAQDSEATPARRIGPIYALASFRSRDIAEKLMAILDWQEPAPPEVINATCQSLERLTGLPYGSAPGEWRRWWETLKDQPIEEWLRIVVDHLSKRTTELEGQIQQQRRERDLIATRLAEEKRRYFQTLPVEEQLRELPVLLSDALAPLRKFAMRRVERILRDSERVPEPVRERLVERLADPAEVPQLRLTAAQLLNDLDYPETAEMITAALDVERDKEIIRGYLEILAKRPTRASLEPIIGWLGDPTAGDAAADALWSVIKKGILESRSLPAARTAARAAFGSRPTAANGRLLAAIGEPEDHAHLEALLDNADAGMRQAVAEGLAWAGASDLLVVRADREDLFPFAVGVLAGGEADLTTFERLARLKAPPAHTKQWERAVVGLAQRLNAADLLAADDLLATMAHVSLRLRAEALGQVADPAAAGSLAQRAPILVRLADLQIGLRDYERAYQTTLYLADSPVTPALAQLKFRAALLAQRFDEASTLSGASRVWLDMFQQLAENQPQVAEALATEIDRRFKLSDEDRAAFEAARRRLPQHAQEARPAVTSGSPANEPPG